MKQSRTRAIKGMPAKRRGTVIVLALAVLAILAIAAVAYVSVVRIDRESSVAVARQANYEQQVNAVVGHISSLLAADLFGNKIVTNSTPRKVGAADVWPKAFEDSEFRDVPSSDLFWRANGGAPLLPVQALDVAQRVAPPDDAWLASVDPQWDYANLANTRAWPQITNLRSAYTWNERQRAWERGDGRYIDLLQWFLQPRNGYADTSLNLSEEGDGNNPMGPAFGVADGANNTSVFNLQMADLDFAPTSQIPRILDPSDERMWADTDGDLRPDARWQQLESLGNLYGLSWVVAARVIDASALANVQTAIEFPYETTAIARQAARSFSDVMGTGKTPADVDLLRLLSYSSMNYTSDGDTRPDVFDSRVRLAQLDRQFELHLNESIGVEAFINDLRENNGTTPDDPAFQGSNEQRYFTWSRGNPLTRLQREALFSYATSTIERPISPFATSYPRRDMVDLFTFYGTNNANILSKFEQQMDGGTDALNFLPDPDDAAAQQDFGPMRAREKPALARKFESNGATAQERDPQPSVQRIKFDIRRQLTMVNGVGQIGPIPVLNNVPVALEQVPEPQYALPLVKFSEIADQRAASLNSRTAATERATNQMLQRLFTSFVWALAPFSTDRQLAPGAPSTTSGLLDDTFHYGGGVTGPAQRIGLTTSTPMNASYAVLRAAAMAVNLFDSSYAEVPGDNTRRQPVVARFFNFPTTSNAEAAAQAVRAVVQPREADAIIGNQTLHPYLPQGTIRNDLLPPRYVGDTGAGVTLISVGRQPFIREMHTIAVYQPNDNPLAPGSAAPQIDPYNANHQLGSIIAVELGNPWPHSIDVQDYIVRLRNAAGQVDITLPSSIILADDPTTTDIDEGVATFVVMSNDPAAGIAELTTAWNAIKAEWTSRIGGVGANVQIGLSADPGVLFQALQPSGSASMATVMLVHRAVDLDGDSTIDIPEYIADRMVADTSNAAGEPFPSVLMAPYLVNLADEVLSDVGVGDRTTGTGRVIVGSTLYRATLNPNGAPAYVIERPTFNTFYRKQPIPNVAGTNPMEQKWVLPILPVPMEPPAQDLFNDLIIDADPDTTYPSPCPTGLSVCRIGREKCRIGEAVRPVYGGQLYDEPTLNPALGAIEPAFQLYVPAQLRRNGPTGYNVYETMQYRSELLQVSPFCHMYVHRDLGGAPVPGDPDTSVAWDAANSLQPWTTFSEQLGSDAHFFYDAQAQAGFNPYLGCLDPSRFIPSQMLVRDVPDSTSIPLALRVLEPFEPIDRELDSQLVQGRVNLNTATPEVLAALPMVAPQYPIPQTGSGAGGLDAEQGINVAAGGLPTGRVNTLLAYRDRTTANNVPITPLGVINSPGTMPGLRQNGSLYSDPTRTRGLVSTGEVALMQPWATYGNMQLGTPGEFFGELGIDGRQISTAGGGQSLDINNLDADEVQLDGSQRDPIDDPEERMAIYRAISNIASTRSDVFIAWFVLRGYDPDLIDTIAVPGGNNPNLEDAQNAMNGLTGTPDSFPLRPTYESRWLVVYDRSNCVKPTDRPRILMQVELPPAKP